MIPNIIKLQERCTELERQNAVLARLLVSLLFDGTMRTHSDVSDLLAIAGDMSDLGGPRGANDGHQHRLPPTWHPE